MDCTRLDTPALASVRGAILTEGIQRDRNNREQGTCKKGLREESVPDSKEKVGRGAKYPESFAGRESRSRAHLPLPPQEKTGDSVRRS